HEAQLNFKLLDFLNIETTVPLNEISNYYGFDNVSKLGTEFETLIDKNKFNIILHPKSKGSAREWGIDNFEKLVELLPKDKFKIFISGTEQEGKLMPEFLKNKNITDLTGKLSLQQFIVFINAANGLVAASTGPLHIAAALNKKAVGLFVPKRPIHPGRWMPLGKDAHYVVFDKECSICKNGSDCNCIIKIDPKQIVDLLEQK
ncbi:MAG: glycosyltransferase family 9 protein, partial [Bacteroidia bacterium]